MSWRHRAVWLGSLLAAFTTNSAQAVRVSAHLSEQGYRVSYSANDPPSSQLVWQDAFSGSAFAYLFESVWLSSRSALPSTELIMEASREGKGEDGIGKYEEKCLHWAAPNAFFASAPKFITCAKNYTEASKVVAFSYSFPDGNPSPSSSSSSSSSSSTVPETLTNFPAISRVKSDFDGRLSWEAVFAASTTTQTYGFAGGPTVFYPSVTANSGPPSIALVVSPLDNFKVSSNARFTFDNVSAPWVPGLIPTITSIPRGFKHTFLVAVGSGITDSVLAWGAALQKYYNVSKMIDPTLSGLSYQTDNGAEYCFCSQNCTGPLLGVTEYLRKERVPVKFMSFQGGWWKNKNLHTISAAPWCVSEWTANETKFPEGVAAFANEVALPLQLYCPYMCPDTPYQHKFPMLASDPSLPGCGGSPNYDIRNAAPDASHTFYQWLFAQGKAMGMISFEPDFLEQNFKCMPHNLENVSASSTWLEGMARAGQESKTPIQYCMGLASDFLESLRHDSVTNARVSSDFYYGSAWDLGFTSLLAHALGLAPSTDTFWTSSNGPMGPILGGCPPIDQGGCPPDHTAAGAALHTLLAAMSTGPVGFSDAINFTDAALIRRTCDEGGRLLQPTKPFTSIDRSVLLEKQLGNGRVYTAASYFTSSSSTSNASSPVVAAHYIVGFQLDFPFPVFATDFFPPLSSSPSTSGDFVYRFDASPACLDGSLASSCGAVFVAANPTNQSTDPMPLFSLPSFDTPPSEAASSSLAPLDPFTPFFATLVPACTSGWVLLGELGKFAAVSVDRTTANQGGRFTHVACTASGLEFGLLGQAAELVNVTMLVPSALSSDSRAPGRPHASPDLHRVKVKTFTLDANGKSSFAS